MPRSTILATSALVAAAAMAPALVPGAARAADACASGFVVVSSPNVSTINDSDLSGVAGRAGNDIWAVGQFAPDSNPNITLTLAEHYDGRAWSIVPTPNVGTQGNALLHVAALANGTAWAVGYRIDDRSFYARSLIEFWDGTAWKVADHPEVGQSAHLFGVDALGPDDVWAVGEYQDPIHKLHTLTEHFDGKSWSVVPSPDPGATGNMLYGVTAVTRDNVWAVGAAYGRAEPSPALVLYWDGKRWSTLAEPRRPGPSNLGLYGVANDGADEVLAVGEAETDLPAIGTSGLALSITTSGLSQRPVAHAGSGDNHFYGIAAPKEGVAWAVGGQFDPASGTVRTLIEQHADDGAGWTVVPSPSPNPADDNILGGVAVIGGDVWAVGVGPNQNARQTLVLHYCPRG